MAVSSPPSTSLCLLSQALPLHKCSLSICYVLGAPGQWGWHGPPGASSGGRDGRKYINSHVNMGMVTSGGCLEGKGPGVRGSESTPWGSPLSVGVVSEGLSDECQGTCKKWLRRCPETHPELLEFTQTHVHRVGEAIQPCHPLPSHSLPAPNPSQPQRLFQWINSLYNVAKVLEFQLYYYLRETKNLPVCSF